MSTDQFMIEKAVFGIPAEVTPNTMYLVRKGLGFDIAISDADGVDVKWLNNVEGLWNNTIVPAHHKIPHNLSVIVPYMFNTRATTTTWNTGFAKILESIKKYKALKFYVILDLYSLSALTEARAIEAVNILSGMGAVPLAYVPTDGVGFDTQIPTIVNTLTSRFGKKLGIFLHSSISLSDYTYNTLSVTMSQQFLFPLVTYTNNSQAPVPTLFDNAHGDMHLYHINGSGSDDTLYNDTLAQYDYHMKSAILYNVSEADIVDKLNTYNNTGCIFVTSNTNPNSIITSTLPSYYDTLMYEINKLYTNDIIGVGGNMSDLVGSIQYFTHTSITGRFLYANGASVKKSTYSALYNKIGYKYGGSGANFNLPDLRNVFIYGADNTGIVGNIQYDQWVRTAILANYGDLPYIRLYPCIYY